MTSASFSLQAAIFSALSDDSTLQSLIGARLYDAVPRAAVFPYAVIGDDTESNWDTATEQGSEHVISVDVWSQNAGRAMEVKRDGVSSLGVSIELWLSMSEAVAPGDAFAITAGCDKQFATCKAKFANAINFRGFPYMIGNDAVMSYPNPNVPLTGGSRYGN